VSVIEVLVERWVKLSTAAAQSDVLSSQDVIDLYERAKARRTDRSDGVNPSRSLGLEEGVLFVAEGLPNGPLSARAQVYAHE
jgi:hypothetical protein